MRQYWNEGWYFTENFTEELLDERCNLPLERIRIPHTTKEVPYHYFDESEYQMLCGYRKTFLFDENWKGKRLLLTFEGVGHEATVYLNGVELGQHHCGYTAFTIDITEAVDQQKENLLVVKVDSRETLNVPPFGFVIDYMTFGGIYRDVYLDVRGNSYIQDVFVKTELLEENKTEACQAKTNTEVTIVNAQPGMQVRQYLRKKETGQDFRLLEHSLEVEDASMEITQQSGKVDLWDIDHPNLYQLRTELIDQDGHVVDEKTEAFGYRTAVFKKDGFYLNDKKVKIRGLNRHQSYPYVGYAMPESMQKLDADILKNELGLNAVRTSHYPQSHYFIHRCDEIGLLVFTEFPGWQHIGDEAWKNQAVENVRDMIIQYRNHPSIILWGVRINESVDDDAFYTRTNQLARELDASRQTGGVRCYKKGSLLEDVYTYNDFSHSGGNAGCEAKAKVTSDIEKAYLVSEYNGHMFPCKSFDWEEKRAEHAIRHARVLNDVASHADIAGSFGWCMFDYNTHKDFGSGDRICYHGVMDMFRNPKLAAAVYAAQQDTSPVLEVSSSFDIGEHPGCNRGDVYIFSNADRVDMYKNDYLIKSYPMKDSSFSSLHKGPVKVDDYIGDALEKEEKMSHKQAEAIKDILNETARLGVPGLSKKTMLKAAYVALRYKMKMSDAVKFFNKYIGDWGGEATVYRFEAIKDEQVIATKVFKPMTQMKLSAQIDHDHLVEVNSYDTALVRIQARDENGNILSFFNDPVKLSVTGPVKLIGPDMIGLPGGMGGTYIRTTGEEGTATLRIETTSGITQEINMQVSIQH